MDLYSDNYNYLFAVAVKKIRLTCVNNCYDDDIYADDAASQIVISLKKDLGNF